MSGKAKFLPGVTSVFPLQSPFPSAQQPQFSPGQSAAVGRAAPSSVPAILTSWPASLDGPRVDAAASLVSRLISSILSGPISWMYLRLVLRAALTPIPSPCLLLLLSELPKLDPRPASLLLLVCDCQWNLALSPAWPCSRPVRFCPGRRGLVPWLAEWSLKSLALFRPPQVLCYQCNTASCQRHSPNHSFGNLCSCVHE